MVVPPLTRRDHKAARTKFFSFFLHDRDVERLKRHKLERYFAADAGVARVSAIWSSNFALPVRSDRNNSLSILRNSSF